MCLTIGKGGGYVSMCSIALGLAALLTAGAEAESQFIYAGEVFVNCTSCSCEGTSDAGPVLVLDNPSTGNRMVSVDGEYSDIAETSCGISIFTVDSTIYELNGIDLIAREFEVVNMSADDDCSDPVTRDAAECYGGEVSKDLGDELPATFYLCICFEDTITRTRVTVERESGTAVLSSVDLCVYDGFLAQLVTVAVENATYFYNSELVIPGRNSSSTIQVAPAPEASAQAFVCGGEAPQTELATTAPTFSPTPLFATFAPSSLPPPAPARAPSVADATDDPESTPATAAPGEAVEGQFVDGGEVSVTCTSCSCEGTSDAGPVMVLDNPSSGNRIVSASEEYSNVVETSCGVSAFASGSTIYELSGIDLIPRDFQVVNMSADGTCATNSVPPADSDCYSGEVVRSLGDGLSMTMNLCLCIQPEDSDVRYNSGVDVTVVGASEVSLPGDELVLCRDAGFFSQLLAVAVENGTYFYNFDLVLPGENSFSTLQVVPAPQASVQAFICGEEAPGSEPATTSTSTTSTTTTTPSPIAAMTTTAPAASSPQEETEPEVATASASTTGCSCDTSGAPSSLSTGTGGRGGVISFAAVLGSAWLSHGWSAATYNSG